MADIFGWYDDLLANRYAPQTSPMSPAQPEQPQMARWQDGQLQAYQPSNANTQEAYDQAWGMTGIPDIKQAYKAYQRGEYLPALGQGAYGAVSLAGNVAPGLGAAARAAPAIGRAAGPVARDVLPMLQNVLADEAGTLRMPRRAAAPAAAPPEMPPVPQQGPASNLGLATPYIGKGSDAPIFDISPKALAGVPNVPQSSLIRPPEFAKGLPDRYKVLGTEENLGRVDEAVKRGLEMPGGGGWYNTMQLLDRFVGEHGQERGTELWKRYMDYVAATSARTPVPENIRTASYLYALDQQGKPFPQGFGRVPGETNARWIGEKPPSPYGMLPNNMQQALNIREGRGLDPLTNPKISSFAENLQGNYAPLTADVHNLRLLGYPKDSPDLGGYRYIEDIQRQRANALGIAPAQYQSSGWVGAANQTGVKGAGGTNEMPFLQRFENKLRDTAAATRLSPEDVLKQFIRGELMLR